MSRKKIIVVDDDVKMLEMLDEVLSLLGYKVVVFENGEHALRYLKRHRCQLIITDIHMPEMSGFALIKAMRYKVPELPVIVITGLGEERYKTTIANLPHTAYLTKPFKLLDISNIIKQLLSVKDESKSLAMSNSQQ